METEDETSTVDMFSLEANRRGISTFFFFFFVNKGAEHLSVAIMMAMFYY